MHFDAEEIARKIRRALGGADHATDKNGCARYDVITSKQFVENQEDPSDERRKRIVFESARNYGVRGWALTKIRYGEKRPVNSGWQNIDLDANDFVTHAGNIGVALGPRSNGLVDVDLDCAEAGLASYALLPKTGFAFGRNGSRGHLFYTSNLHAIEGLGDKAAIQFADPISGRMIVELRIGGGGAGAQTVVPPSIHANGDRVAFEDGLDGEPIFVEGRALYRKVALLASVALLARHYPKDRARDANTAIAALTMALTQSNKRERSQAWLIAEAVIPPGVDRDSNKALKEAIKEAGEQEADRDALAALWSLYDALVVEKLAEWLGVAIPQPAAATQAEPHANAGAGKTGPTGSAGPTSSRRAKADTGRAERGDNAGTGKRSGSDDGATGERKPPSIEAMKEIVRFLAERDVFKGYDEWVTAGMALKFAYGDEGLPLWRLTCWPDPKTQGEILTKWRSFKRSAGRVVTLGTIIKMAKDYGYAFGGEFNAGDWADALDEDAGGAGLFGGVAGDGDAGTSGDDADYDDDEDVEDDSDGVGHDGPDYAEVIMSLPGAVGEIARFVLAGAQRPQPRFAVAAALTVVGLAAARHIKTPTGSQVNLYNLTLAPTAAGKEWPLDAVKEIIKACGLSRLLGPAGFASDVAAYKRLSTNPVTFTAIDEMADIIEASIRKNASTHEAKVNAVLKIAHNTRHLVSMEAAGRDTYEAVDPCLFITGATTPKRFAEALTGKHIADGTANRMLLFRGLDAPAFNRRPGASKVPPGIIEDVKKIAFQPGANNIRSKLAAEDERIDSSVKDADALFEPKRAAWGVGVEDACYDYVEAHSAEAAKDGYLDHLHARCGLNAIRVATILAISQNPSAPVVEMRHWQAACLLVDTALRDFGALIANHTGDNEYADVSDRVLARIKRSKDGVTTRTQLARTFQRQFAAKMYLLDNILGSLEAAGMIERSGRRNPHGRQTVVIKLTPRSGRKTS